MTTLVKPVKRVAQATLDSCHGNNRGRRIVVTLIPAANDGDMIELKPQGRRSGAAKRCKLVDLYSYMIRCEVNVSKMEKLRQRKEAKRIAAERRRSNRIIYGGRNDE